MQGTFLPLLFPFVCLTEGSSSCPDNGFLFLSSPGDEFLTNDVRAPATSIGTTPGDPGGTISVITSFECVTRVAMSISASPKRTTPEEGRLVPSSATSVPAGAASGSTCRMTAGRLSAAPFCPRLAEPAWPLLSARR